MKFLPTCLTKLGTPSLLTVHRWICVHMQQSPNSCKHSLTQTFNTSVPHSNPCKQQKRFNSAISVDIFKPRHSFPPHIHTITQTEKKNLTPLFYQTSCYSIKRKDFKFPVLKSEDLEEDFVLGSGPGGQSVQTTANCVVLKHKPSGIFVKCHATRSLEQNRKEARKILEEKLDLHYNGDESYLAKLEEEKGTKKAKKKNRSKAKLALKKAFKEREDLILTKPVVVRFTKMSENATTPTTASALAAGYDLYSAKDLTIQAKGKGLVPTDLKIALPDGCYGRIAPRSGLANKYFIDVGAGVIDQDYRGPVGVILFNFSDNDFEVKKGDRIAQLICERIFHPVLEEVEFLDATVRGSDGFGSSGIN